LFNKNYTAVLRQSLDLFEVHSTHEADKLNLVADVCAPIGTFTAHYTHAQSYRHTSPD